MPELERIGATATVFAVTDMIGREFYGFEVMTTSMLTALISRGWEIGSHTQTHPNLTELSVLQVRAELRNSKERLKEITSRNVVSFAYPFGAYDNRVKSLAAELYTSARTISAYPPLRVNSIIPRDRAALSAMSTYEHPIVLPFHLFSNHIAARIGFRQRKGKSQQLVNSSRRAIEARFIGKWLRKLRSDQWLILCFHNVTTGPPTSYSVTLNEFREIAKVIGQEVEVVNIGEVIMAS